MRHSFKTLASSLGLLGLALTQSCAKAPADGSSNLDSVYDDKATLGLVSLFSNSVGIAYGYSLYLCERVVDLPVPDTVEGDDPESKPKADGGVEHKNCIFPLEKDGRVYVLKTRDQVPTNSLKSVIATQVTKAKTAVTTYRAKISDVMIRLGDENLITTEPVTLSREEAYQLRVKANSAVSEIIVTNLKKGDPNFDPGLDRGESFVPSDAAIERYFFNDAQLEYVQVYPDVFTGLEAPDPSRVEDVGAILHILAKQLGLDLSVEARRRFPEPRGINNYRNDPTDWTRPFENTYRDLENRYEKKRRLIAEKKEQERQERLRRLQADRDLVLKPGVYGPQSANRCSYHVDPKFDYESWELKSLSLTGEGNACLAYFFQFTCKAIKAKEYAGFDCETPGRDPLSGGLKPVYYIKTQRGGKSFYFGSDLYVLKNQK